ncbi:MAG: thiamine-phosphate kinase [Bacteroidales bacterium]|nr:thiamine-phosphate kinase [Bacteroidales bacterium]
MTSKKIRTIEELGEFGLIDHLTSGFSSKQESTYLGVGDDAAIINHGTYLQVVTTDLLLEGVHFDLVYTPLKHLGYKAVVVNLSDVYAMNAAPRQITVSLGISEKFSVEAMEDFYSGVKLACERFKVDLVGGDTSSSMTGLLISVTAIGTALKEELALRSGARNNQLICVTGDLGAAFMGLKILEREKLLHAEDPEFQPKLSGYDYILERYLKPEPRVDVLLALKEAGITPGAMIDISDGLSSELLHICKASACGCQVYDERIPIADETREAAAEFQMEPLVAALHGGEDYELLFTVPLSAYDQVSAIKGVSVIGNITDKKGSALLVGNDGNAIRLEAQSWNATGD